MRRRRFLRNGSAGLALYPFSLGGSDSGAPLSEGAPLATKGRGMNVHLGDVTYSGATAPGLVVEFGDSGRLVCWAEAQYVPFWDINNVWVTTEWFESLGVKSAYDFEPISDKPLRHTRVEIQEIGPARAVVHWRYALGDTRGRIFHDNTTAEEFHTVYPDGVAVRKLVGFPGTGEPREGQPRMWEVAEVLVVLPKGSRLTQTLSDAGGTLSNIGGDSFRHRFTQDPKPFSFEDGRADEIIKRLCQVHPSSRTWNEFIWHGGLAGIHQPFLVVPNDPVLFPQLPCHICRGRHPEILLWQRRLLWKHYPLWHGEYHIGNPATEEDLKDRPLSTSYITVHPWTHPTAFDQPDPTIPFDPAWNPPRGTTWLMLQGVVEGDASVSRRWAASWLNPATVEATSGRYLGYDHAARAYHFEPSEGRVEFHLRTLPGAAQINPVFIVANWAFGNPVVTVDGREVVPGDCAESWHGDKLILWLKREVSDMARVQIRGWPLGARPA